MSEPKYTENREKKLKHREKSEHIEVATGGVL